MKRSDIIKVLLGFLTKDGAGNYYYTYSTIEQIADALHQKEQEGMGSEEWLKKEHPVFCNRVKKSVSELHLSVYAALMEQYAASRIAEEWVSVKDNPPTEIAGCEIVCLKNGAVMEMNYSNFSSRLRWWRMGIGDEHPENPVMYRMPLPKPPKTK